VRDSAGGKALTFTALSAVATGILTRLLDSTTQAVDQQGVRYLVSVGNTGRYLGLSLLIPVAYFGARAFFDAAGAQRNPARLPLYTAALMALIVWWQAAFVLRGNELTDFQQDAQLVIALTLVAAVVLEPPTLRTLVNITHVMNAASICALAYGLSHPATQEVCRSDKCGIFGDLFVGYLFQENGMARAVVLLLPAAVVIRSRGYLLFTIALTGILVAATASRTSELTLILVVAGIFVLRSARFSPRSIPVPLRAVPLLAIIASAAIFMYASPAAFTNRGYIYQAIRQAFGGREFLLGARSDFVSTLQLPFSARAVGEHGQVPHLLVAGGFPALALFVIGVASLITWRHWDRMETRIGLLFVLAASTQFMTEPTWEMNVRLTTFVAMVLSAGLFARAVRSSRGELGDQAPTVALRASVAPGERAR
jgi:hypothetical protein